MRSCQVLWYVRPVRDTLHLEGKELEFKVIELDWKRYNVLFLVVPLSNPRTAQSAMSCWKNLQEGMEVKVSLRPDCYGVFVIWRR